MPARILVVDDDAGTLELLAAQLAELGAKARTVRSSKEAARLIEREKFEGVFLDYLMPEIDGLELARRVRRSRSNHKVPIVMITGDRETKTMAEGFKAGVTFFLPKPITRENLRRLVNATRGAMLEELRRYRRVPLTVAVNWRSPGVGSLKGQSVNISQGGMLVRVSCSTSPGAEVTLEFELPNFPQKIETAAVVVRSPEDGVVGVRFKKIRPEEKTAIADLAQTLGPPAER